MNHTEPSGRVRRRAYSRGVVSRVALLAITSPENVAARGDGELGARKVRDQDVVAELQRLEGLSEQDARRSGRDAVAHIGGYIQRGVRLEGRRSGAPAETWWVPEYRIRKREP